MKKLIVIIALFFAGFNYAQSNFFLAEDYFRQGEYNKAAQLYETLLKKSPFNTTYMKRLVTCFQETDQFQRSEEILRSALQKNPSQKYLLVEIGFNFERQQKKELALKEYEKALLAIDKSPSLGGMIGRMFQQNNLLDNAIEAYNKTMTLNPNLNYQFQVAQIYGEKGDFDKMFNSYIALIEKNENYIGTVQRFASRYITDDPSNKNNISFKRALLKTSISNPKNVWNELLSWLFTKQKEYSKALIQEKALFRRNPDFIGGISKLGKIAFNDKDFSASKKCYQFFLENTNFIDAKIQAELYILKSSIELKEENLSDRFQQVFSKYGLNKNTIPLQITYADYLTFQRNKPEEAEKVLEKALTFPSSKFQQARIKLKIGEVLVFTNRFNKALIYFSQVQTKLKNHPLSQEARFKVAQTSYFKGDFKWAMAQLKVLKGSTTQLIANDAADLFLVISDNEPRDSIPSGLNEFSKADLLSFQNRNQEAIALYSELIKNYQGREIEDESLYNQALLFVKENQIENAITNLLKVVAINKEGILVDDAYYQLAEIYRIHRKDQEKASEYYQKIIFEYPSSIYLVDARKKYRELRGDNVN